MLLADGNDAMYADFGMPAKMKESVSRVFVANVADQPHYDTANCSYWVEEVADVPGAARGEVLSAGVA
jgi:hypothetical protein